MHMRIYPGILVGITIVYVVIVRSYCSYKIILAVYNGFGNYGEPSGIRDKVFEAIQDRLKY